MLLFAHNPDYYNTATLPYYWEFVDTGSPSGTAGVRADGYLGRPALTSTGGHSYVIHWPHWPPITDPGGKREWRMGGRFRFESYPASPTMIMAANGWDGGFECQLVLNPDGTLSIYRGDLTEEIAGPSTAVLALDTTYKLGFKGYAARVGGKAEAYWNVGALPVRVLSVQGNTASDGDHPVTWDACTYGLVEDSAVNHVYAIDSYGFLNNLYPSLITKVLYPASNGSAIEWVPNTGTVPAALDDTVPDMDTTRIHADVDNAAYTVAVDTLPTTYGIIAVQQTALVKNLETELASFRFLVEQDGAFFDGVVEGQVPYASVYDWFVATSDYHVKRRLDHGMPKNGYGWVTADVNAARFGGRLVV